jgi:hypothetical protein
LNPLQGQQQSDDRFRVFDPTALSHLRRFGERQINNLDQFVVVEGL